MGTQNTGAQRNLRQLARSIKTGETRIADMVAMALAKANQSDSVFVAINERIHEQAVELDAALRSGKRMPSLSGIPMTLKDLFDVKGEITLAGSVVLKHTADPAEQDCRVVASLRRAGLLFLGRTNMSEFAFSGMGLNPHYGHCKSIWDRDVGRLPGGSSSGSAVSVAEGIVSATMGSDTAGSCRIPAAFNGVVGVKPSYGRYSLEGVYPLSPTSDAPGPIAIDLDSCFILDKLITEFWDGFGDIPSLEAAPVSSIKLMIPESIVIEDLDREVRQCFDRTVTLLESSGVTIIRKPCPVIDRCIDMFMNRPVVGYESRQHHKEMLSAYGDEYDPYVQQRISNFRKVTQSEQQKRYEEKAGIIADFNAFIGYENVDAVIYPTVACLPPTIEETLIPENTGRINLRCLRNTSSANYFDGCSISLPCHNGNEGPVGLMISSVHGQDENLYRTTATIEGILNANRL